MEASHVNPITGPLRLPFLLLTPACVLLGVGSAVWSGEPLAWQYLPSILIAAICGHMSVNALNEYDDFKSGLDFKTEKTPFSGGSGALPANPGKAHYGLIAGLLTLAIAAAIGIVLIVVRGWALLPLGALGVVTVLAYTRYFTRNWFLCLIAPGIGFGPVMVCGTHFVLTGSYSALSILMSLVPFFLVSNLLLLNQFPDIHADKAVGRNHLIIKYGRKTGVVVYTVFLAAAYVTVLAAFAIGLMPKTALIGLLTIVIAIPLVRGVFTHSNDIRLLVPHLAKNVIINLSTPVLLSIGLIIGR